VTIHVEREMKQTSVKRVGCIGLILSLLTLTLVGCKSMQATPTVVSKSLGDIYISPSLDASYPGALNAYRQLMLGTLRLEGTDNAITSEQAKTLVVLWQALAGRALQSDAEHEAVLAYIETQMTPAQLQAIAAMRLTQNDLQSPLPDNNPGFGRGGPGQRGDAGTPAGTPGAPSATRSEPAGGAMPPQMSTRQAQFSRATPQAGGATRGASNGTGAGSAQDTILLNSLIRLLSQRATEGAAPPASSRTPNRTPAPRAIPSPTPATP
jgi:hypothetical protein